MIHTHTISGAGNTFTITWENIETLKLADRKNFVKRVCEKTNTDGFIFLSWLNETQNYLQWDFYNNDGSVAEMCGNATRCVAYYVKNIKGYKGEFLKIKSLAGDISIRILKMDLFEVQMTVIHKFKHNKYFYCDTGVPHIVIPIENFHKFRDLKSWCQELRFHNDFQPRGTNVTLIDLNDSLINKIKAVTYERGVEDFTQACGTGAMAAAYYNLDKRGQAETLVEMPGGALKMNLSELRTPLMTGEAIIIGEYNVSE